MHFTQNQGAFLGSGACLLASFSIEPEAHCQVDVVCSLNCSVKINCDDLIIFYTQVPCGIYDDGGRIDGLKEDTTTIRKAMVIKYC